MVRLAIVGIGHLGRFHLQKAIAHPDVEVMGLVDTSETRSNEIEKEFDLSVEPKLTNLNPHDIDACILAAPTVDHEKLGRQILEQGWHLLVEKPIADNIAAAQKLVTIAKEKDLLLQVGMTERFNPAVQAALEIADRPRYMTSERLGPFVGRSTEIDVIRDLMIHDLDIMLNLVPSEVIEIRAVGVPLITNQVDMANVRLEFADGAVAQLTASRASMAKSRSIRLFTTSQYLSIDCDARTVKSVQRLPAPEGSPWPMIKEQPVTFDKDQDPLAAQLDNFIAAVAGKGTMMVDGQTSLRSLQLAEDIVAAIKMPVMDSKE